METTIYDLPNDVINLLLYHYLPINDIHSCLLTAKLFHCLNDHQIKIIKQATIGLISCIVCRQFDASKWLYELKIKLGISIKITESNEYDKFYANTLTISKDYLVFIYFI